MLAPGPMGSSSTTQITSIKLQPSRKTSEWGSMVLITVPVFLPLVMKYGYDPMWFAIIVVIVVEVGLIHPPVGMNLFVIQSQAPDLKITDIYRGILPFLIAPLILIVMLFMAPEMALWLPGVLYN